MKKRGKIRTVAVIDIGSTAVRLVIMTVDAVGEYKRIDRASRPVNLGRDVFLSKIIQSENMLQVITILLGFTELLAGYGIKPGECHVLATSAVREARNRDTFVDRVFIKTGFKVNIIDGVEENHLTYIAVLRAVRNIRGAFSKANSIIMEVGGGTTELMILLRGKMKAAQSLKVGTVRLEQQVQSNQQSGRMLEELLREQFRNNVAGLNSEAELKRIRYFVMVGGDARMAAYRVGEQKGEHYAVIPRDDFIRFVDEIKTRSIDEIVAEQGVSYIEAEGLLPALLIYRIFLEQTSATEIIVPDVSIREGILLRDVLGESGTSDVNFGRQVAASAKALAQRFHVDLAHADFVSRMSLELFDQLEDEHGLGLRERIYLEVAALLHDVGYFINQSGHHKHGMYIVANSEVFGLSRDEVQLVSVVVRYHRGARPLSGHSEYSGLSRKKRLIVMKLAAILRVADALDRSHSQHLGNLKISLQEDRMLIRGNFSGDLSVERFGLSSKAQLFEEVYGYRVILS